MGWHRSVAAAALCAAALAACGGGAGVTADPTPIPVPDVVAPAISGVAATGAPLAGMWVHLMSGDSVVDSHPVEEDGTFRIFLVVDPNVPHVMYVDTADGPLYAPIAPGATHVNITPLTNLVAAQLSPSGNPAALAAELLDARAAFDGGQVKQAGAGIMQALQPLLVNVPGAGIDPVGGTFAADGTGHDRLLSALATTIALAPDGATLAIGMKAAASGAGQPPSVTFRAGTAPPRLPDSVASLPLPPAGMDALVAAWLAKATTCFALPRSERVTGTSPTDTVKAAACRQLFWNDDPAAFRHGGLVVNSTGAFSGLFADSATATLYSDARLELVEADGSLLVTWRETSPDRGLGFLRNVFRIQDGRLKVVGDQARYGFAVRAAAERREFLDGSGNDYLVTGYDIAIPNVDDGTGPLFDRVVVTAPGGATVTLEPMAGMGALGLVRPSDGAVTGTSLLRLASRFVDGRLSASPKALLGETNVWLPNPAGQDKEWTDAQILALQEVARWKAEFFLAGNTGSTPDATQYTVSAARPFSMGQLATRAWASLTPLFRGALATVGAGGSVPLAVGAKLDVSAAGGEPAWQYPDGASAPGLIRALGLPSEGVPMWDDSAFVSTSSRRGTIRCSAQSPADVHCSLQDPATYGPLARMLMLQLAAIDPHDREWLSSFAAGRVSLPLD